MWSPCFAMSMMSKGCTLAAAALWHHQVTLRQPVCSSHTSPRALQPSVMSRADGVRPSLLIDCSTIDPPSAREVAEAVQSVRLHKLSRPFPECSVAHPSMIDAPVSGGIPAAAAGSLTFMVSRPSLTSKHEGSNLSLQFIPQICYPLPVPPTAHSLSTLQCGGDKAAVRAAEPFLRAMGKEVIHCGDSGAGAAAKVRACWPG